MTEGPKGKYPLLQQKLESSFNFFYGTFDYTGKSRRLTDAMYKFVFYFIIRFFFWGGGVNYWPKTQQFCKQSPI